MSRPLDRRAFLKTVTASAAALTLGGSAGLGLGLGGEGRAKPNIVYILADDLGYGDLTCLNPNAKIPTPNADRLAREGTRFTDAHTGSAVCTPTRYGLLTGRYAWRTRLKKGVLWGWSPPLIEKGRMTVGSLLNDHGYVTGCVGKWHLGLDYLLKSGKRAGEVDEVKHEDVDYAAPITGGPTDLGFDYFFGIPASLDMIPYIYLENDRIEEAPTGHTPGRKGKAFFRAGPCAPSFDHERVLPRLTTKAVEFIDRHAGGEKPFFLYFPLPAPHTPVLPIPEVRGKSEAGEYGDFVHQVDHTVGAVMEALKRNGVAGDTLIIYTSDNGSTWEAMTEYDHQPSGPLRGRKSDAWDGGHRVPFLVRWPGVVPAGGMRDDTICHTDLLATCAAMMGATLPEGAGEDSYDIGPALRGETLDRPIREATVHHSISGMFAIRKGPYKLIEGKGSGGWTKGGKDDPAPGQLYRMDKDLGEKTNRYADEPEKVKELMALLNRYRDEGRSRTR